MKKVCSFCKEEKILDQFHKQSKKYSHLHSVAPEKVGTPYGGTHHSRCKSCRSKTRVLCPSGHGAGLRNQKLREQYGILQSDYDRMLSEQDGGCSICGCLPQDNTYGVLYVDHCHKTGKVRGLLCSLCNAALGQLRDRPDLCIKAADYLRSHQVDEKC